MDYPEPMDAAPAADRGTEPVEPAGPAAEAAGGLGLRRPATAAEIKALSHPLRIRILRLCQLGELTNKELAERLDRDPGTVLYHVRHLVDAGMLTPAPVRTGSSGALEKPYRSNGKAWWFDGPLNDSPADVKFAPVEAFQEELREAGLSSIQTYDRFLLHLAPDEVEHLERRVLAILDEYIATDHERLDRPALGGMFLLHRLAD
jgi:DNA-binding transcriptional ArsR family regulator